MFSSAMYQVAVAPFWLLQFFVSVLGMAENAKLGVKA
jgi:hypothetical protein